MDKHSQYYYLPPRPQYPRSYGPAPTPLSELPPASIEHLNPLQAGLQYGLVGAGMGIGTAALRRAIRLKVGDKEPVGVAKPMMLGALIGSALGSGLSYAGSRAQSVPPPAPQEKRSQYAGLCKIAGLDKEALPVAALLPLAWKGLMAAGAIGGGIGAARSGTQTVKRLRKGDYAGAGRAGLATAGNLLATGFGAGQAGSLLRNSAVLARKARMAGLVGKGGRAAKLLTKVPASKLRAAQNTGNKLHDSMGIFSRWPALLVSMGLPVDAGKSAPKPKIPVRKPRFNIAKPQMPRIEIPRR
jgi:hypothetical protein